MCWFLARQYLFFAFIVLRQLLPYTVLSFSVRLKLTGIIQVSLSTFSFQLTKASPTSIIFQVLEKIHDIKINQLTVNWLWSQALLRLGLHDSNTAAAEELATNGLGSVVPYPISTV